MTIRITCAAVGSVLALSSVVALAMTAEPASGDGAVLELKSLREIRVLDLVEQDDDGFSMPGQEPGLVLTFGVKLPAGKRLVSVQQPENILASDATGRDLTGIEPGFMGEREYVTLEDAWGDDPVDQLQLHLSQTDRKAATFDVKTDFAISIHAGMEQITLDLDGQWTSLDQAITGAAAVQARVAESMGTRGIEVKPASAADLLESVEVVLSGRAVEANGWFSDGRTITYMIDEHFEAPATVKLTVRTGFETIPVKIDLKGQPLP